MNVARGITLGVLSGLLGVSVHASNVVLDFEGLKNMESVQNYYDGGEGSLGSRGPDYNVTFSGNALALIDADQGGSGNFANEPSPDTVLFFLDSSPGITMDKVDGFDKGFSFYYSSGENEGDVEVWTDYNATGRKIATLHLDKTPHLGKGDPTGDYDNWARKSVTFDGTAKSIVFKGVSNRIAFDNITFDPNAGDEVFRGLTLSTGSLNNAPIKDIYHAKEPGFIIHGDHPLSTQFELLLSYRDKTGKFQNNICNRFFFTLEDANKHRARQFGCDDRENSRLYLHFQIEKPSTYIENPEFKICKKSEPDKCLKINFPKFSVWGTTFDINKDAYSFANTSWNLASTTFNHDGTVSKKNDLAKFGDVIADYLTFEGKEYFWRDVGYYNIKLGRFPIFTQYNDYGEHSSIGLCYGMSATAISQFTAKSRNRGWADYSPMTTQQWEKAVATHFVNGVERNPKNPYSTNSVVHDFKRNDMRALRKIMYYFVGQPAYRGGKNWVGKDVDVSRMTSKGVSIAIKILKSNEPVLFSLDSLHNEGSHTITATQIIKYNNRYKIVTYDNNFPTTYETFFLKKISSGSLEPISYFSKVIPKFKTIKNMTSIRYFKKSYVGTITRANLRVNNVSFMKHYKKLESASRQKSGNTHITKQFVDGVKISYMGMSLITVKQIDKNNIKTLTRKEYQIEQINLLNNEIYLKNGKYQITFRKYKDFTLPKIFVTRPLKNSKMELAAFDFHHYDPKADIVTLKLDGSKISLLLSNGTVFSPTESETYETTVDPVSSFTAYYRSNSVVLQWANPTHPNYDETVIVKKEGNVSTGLQDGEEIYRGTGTSFEDTDVEVGKNYYYTAYVLDKNSTVQNTTTVSIDTYKYSIYGKVLDQNGKALPDVAITLYNDDRTRIVGTTATGANGVYAFNDILDGKYHLSFDGSSVSYDVSSCDRKVTIDNGSKSADCRDAELLPALSVTVPPIVRIGDTVKIEWKGIGIDSDAKLSIVLDDNGTKRTLSENVDYSRYGYLWDVRGSEGVKKIKVVDSEDNVWAESTITVLKRIGSDFDFNKDGKVDRKDIDYLVDRWPSNAGEKHYSLKYDFNKDGKIDVQDIMIAVSHILDK